jgi:gag-polypeptide of LTR copia-type
MSITHQLRHICIEFNRLWAPRFKELHAHYILKMTDVRLTEKTVGVLSIGSWPQWSRKCHAILRSSGMWSYVDGDKKKPPTEAVKLSDWNEMNDRIVGTLCQVVEDSLAQEIEHYTTASTAWEHLRKKTYQSGVNSKFNALQNAMWLHFITTATASSVLTDLKDYMEAIYSDAVPTKDEWTVGILLHAMCNSDFDDLRKILMASSSTLTPSSIIQRIEAETQESYHQEQIKNGDTLLAAKQKQTKGTNKSLKCLNCAKPGHTIEKCWETGGGNEGKAPDWWKSIKEKERKDAEKKKKKRQDRAHVAISEVSDSPLHVWCLTLRLGIDVLDTSTTPPSSAWLRRTLLQVCPQTSRASRSFVTIAFLANRQGPWFRGCGRGGEQRGYLKKFFQTLPVQKMYRPHMEDCTHSIL